MATSAVLIGARNTDIETQKAAASTCRRLRQTRSYPSIRGPGLNLLLKIEAIQRHDLGPGRDEIPYEDLLGIFGRIELGNCSQL